MRNRFSSQELLAFLILPLCSTHAAAATYQVPSEAYPTIQAGIDACSDGDQVLVAPGTYTGPGNRNLDFGGVDLLLVSESGPEATVIDCEGSARGILFQSGETRAAKVEGFTLLNGHDGEGAGGAILCVGSSPTLERCVLSGNNAAQGGALAALLDSSPRFFQTTVSGNLAHSPEGGGGAWLDGDSGLQIDRSIIWGNCATRGADVFNHGSMGLYCSAVDSAGVEGSGQILWVLGTWVFDDPLFCEPEPCSSAPTDRGEYTLTEGSPCLPGSSPCGLLIGALDQGCSPPTATQRATWGRIKAAFR